jgi:hypothetical protein
MKKNTTESIQQLNNFKPKFKLFPCLREVGIPSSVKKKMQSSSLVLAFVSVTVWRSFISCQTIDIKCHTFSEQALE